MKFRLSTSKPYYTKEEADILNGVGFSADKPKEGGNSFFKACTYHQPDAIEIEISTLEELIELSDAVGDSLVIDSESITIYDYYLE